ncbi:MAG TPA: hypothetical protein VEC93_21230 [Anaerolineae bacterium]|nr:hypothetical protein [Anaerolineae bacterium]
MSEIGFWKRKKHLVYERFSESGRSSGSSSLTTDPKKFLSDIKIFYDPSGEASEVLISYELFLKFLSYLPEADQAYFWMEEWQAKERTADQANAEGRFETFSSVDEMLEFLDSK